jgi:hypothetical protein
MTSFPDSRFISVVNFRYILPDTPPVLPEGFDLPPAKDWE